MYTPRRMGRSLPHHALGAAGALVIILAVAACGPTGRIGGDRDLLRVPPPDLADPIAGDRDLWSPDDGSIDPGRPDGPDPDTCHEEKFVPQKVGDPDIILVQDRSGSMSEGTPTKYEQMSKAVSNVLNQLEQAKAPIYWGLLFFPSDNDCAVKSTPDVAVAPGNAIPIGTTIKGKSPGGNTPMTKAINSAVTYYDTVKDGRGHYLLLATDGEPNCESGGGLPKNCTKNSDCAAGEVCQTVPLLGGICVSGSGSNATTMAIAAARQKGIKTYVVGISLSGTSATLNKMAEEGGTARSGSVKYYDVSDQASLEAALKNITSQIISCTFQLKDLPQSNQKVIVQIGGINVPRDTTHQNGWDIDSATKTLTIYGNSCTQLQANPGTVSIGYTCPPVG